MIPMFIVDFLAFVVFNFWLNLIVMFVLGLIAVINQYDRPVLTIWCWGFVFLFGLAEAWNIVVWVHQTLHATSMG